MNVSFYKLASTSVSICRISYDFLNSQWWFNIINIIAPSPDDGSLEPKRYSVNIIFP